MNRKDQLIKSQSKRNSGVIILAGLHFIQSLVLLGYGLYLYSVSDQLQSGPERFLRFLPIAWVEGYFSTIAMVIIALTGLIIAVALFQVRRWSWMAAILLQGVGLLAGLFDYLRGQPNYVGMVFGVILVFYLNQREIKMTYRSQSRAPELGTIRRV